MVSPMLKVCLSMYTLLRSHLRSHFVRELLYQEVFSLHPPSVTVDCCQLFPKNSRQFLHSIVAEIHTANE